MTTLISDTSHDLCTCGSSSFFYSEEAPQGFFCVDCGKPNASTQITLDAEQPGYWS